MNSSKPRTRSAPFSWMDFKVGLRMLARSPGITIIGTLAIAIAIALSTIYVEGINKFRNPRLPIENAERVVSIRNWDASESRVDPRALYDFALWREQARTVEGLGAAVVFVRNLVTADGRVEPARGAEITASAFRLMGTSPVRGRLLTEQDERLSEPPVVVIGHDLWQSRFAGDAEVVGQTVQLGTVTATIVGIMPEGFGFPTSEEIWAPLRVDGATLPPRTGPAVSVFGRLAPGASMEAAQAELSGIGARIAADNPETHEHLRPLVTHYAEPLLGAQQEVVIRTILSVVAGIFLALLTVMCTNVATLVFARTAARGWEISVRSALGASRTRIISQLFVEALVLAATAAVLGLLIAKVALGWGLGQMAGSDGLPFWVDASLSWKTALAAAALAVVGAVIVGVLPALRVTRQNVQEALRNEGAGRAGLRFGGFWTTMVIVQVGITVALMPLAGAGVFEANRFSQRAEGIGADQYLTASLSMDREDYGLDSAALATRARSSVEELQRRLSAEPGVEHVTFADRLPVEDQFKYQIAVDSLGGAPANTLRRSTLVNVGPGFFETFGTSVVAGRAFTRSEYESGDVMMVNQSFVENVFAGRNAVGQRIRIVAGEIDDVAGETWYEIIGVVGDFGWQLPRPEEQSAMYLPSVPITGRASQLAMRTREPGEIADRLRRIAAEVDPTLRLTEVRPLADSGGGEATIGWALTAVAWLIGSIVLTLSAMGIHALMAFTVARRTREIGIRAALGARPRRIVAGVFSRAFLQIGAGILLGTAVAMLLGLQAPREIMLLLGTDAIMLVVGLVACAVPLRRALRIDPTEALRAEV